MSGLVAEVRESLSLPGPSVARAIRQAAGVSQARVADELGVHWLTVQRWESGEHVPRGELRLRYRRLLNELDEAVREMQEAS